MVQEEKVSPGYAMRVGGIDWNCPYRRKTSLGTCVSVPRTAFRLFFPLSILFVQFFPLESEAKQERTNEDCFQRTAVSWPSRSRDTCFRRYPTDCQLIF